MWLLNKPVQKQRISDQIRFCLWCHPLKQNTAVNGWEGAWLSNIEPLCQTFEKIILHTKRWLVSGVNVLAQSTNLVFWSTINLYTRQLLRLRFRNCQWTVCPSFWQELHHYSIHWNFATQQPEPPTLPPPHLQPGSKRGYEDRSYFAQPAG